MWGHTDSNEKGSIFEDFVLKADVAILNDRNFTLYQSLANTFSIIDLAISSTDSQLDFVFEGLKELCGSDHYLGQLKLVML